MNLSTLLTKLKIPSEEVANVYVFGSRLWGYVGIYIGFCALGNLTANLSRDPSSTATEKSDWDFIIVDKPKVPILSCSSLVCS